MKTLPCGRKKQLNTPVFSKKSESPPWQATLNSFLKKEGLRATTPRERVAEIALQRKSHFEIQTLLKEVQNKYPEISPATVYRSVITLCDAGLLKETLQSHTGVTLYEANDDDHHDHIICIDCGEIFEFHDDHIETAQKSATQKLSFQEVRHQHVIYAKCDFFKK